MAIDDHVLKFARKRARELAGQFGFVREDEEDIQQELLLDYLRRLPKFDGSRASIQTFGQRLINNHAASLVAAQKAKCRDYRLRESLDELTDLGLEVAVSRASDPLKVIQFTAVAKAVSKLPEEQRRIAMLIGETSISEIARILRISRRRVYSHVEAIRAALEASGVGPEWRQSRKRLPPAVQIAGRAGI